MVARVWRSGQGNLCADHGFCVRGGSRSVSGRFHGDGVLRGRRRRILLEDGLDLHVVARHGELVVPYRHVAAHNLPLLKVVARVWRSGQGDFRSGCRRGGIRAACAVAVIPDGDGVFRLGSLDYRDGKLLNILTQIVDRHDGKDFGPFPGGGAAYLSGDLV